MPAFSDKDKRYYPEEVDVVVGTIDSGNKFSVREVDGGTLNISEIAGALPMGGFDIIFTFKGVLAPQSTKRLKLVIDGYYDGNVAHEVKIYFWDYLIEDWSEVTTDAKDLPDETAQDTYTFEFVGDSDGFPSDTVKGGTGEVKIRVIHNDSGNSNHDIFFDKVSLGFTSQESTYR